MPTRRQERMQRLALEHEACAAVLDTAELLETILSCLDMRTLLVSQAVSRRWQNTVTGSSHLQRALYFRPQTQQDDATQRTQNPLLAEIFSPWFQSEKTFRHGAISALPFAKKTTRLASFMHPSASWRLMLVSQPPVYTLGCWMSQDSTSGELPYYSSRVLTFPNGLRMGKLYDLAQRWLFGNNPSASCVTHWTPRESSTLHRFMGFLRTSSVVPSSSRRADVDMILKGWACFDGYTGLCNPPKGGKKLELRKLTGKLLIGPASNYGSGNKYVEYRGGDYFPVKEVGRTGEE